MFRGLLNRVKVDLVRTYLKCGTEPQLKPAKANGVNRPSFCASLLQHPDRGSLGELEMSFLAGAL